MSISNKIKKQQSKIRIIHGSPVITTTSDVTIFIHTLLTNVSIYSELMTT